MKFDCWVQRGLYAWIFLVALVKRNPSWSIFWTIFAVFLESTSPEWALPSKTQPQRSTTFCRPPWGSQPKCCLKSDFKFIHSWKYTGNSISNRLHCSFRIVPISLSPHVIMQKVGNCDIDFVPLLLLLWLLLLIKPLLLSQESYRCNVSRKSQPLSTCVCVIAVRFLQKSVSLGLIRGRT